MLFHNLYRSRKMFNRTKDIEYMNPYVPGFVTGRIHSLVADMQVGKSVKFSPETYEGIPFLHFYNTLKSTMVRTFGSENIHMQMQQQYGVIEAMRLR